MNDPNQNSNDVHNASLGEQYIPTPMPDNANLTMWSLSSQDILKEIEHDLRGEIFNEETEKWELVAEGKPLMNDEGIRSIVSLARTIVNKVAFLSNLSEDMVLQISRDFADDLADLLFNNIEQFEIKRTHLNIIVTKISYIIYVALQRAYEEGERRFLKTAERRIVSVRQDPNEKKGFWIFGKGN